MALEPGRDLVIAV